MSTMYRINMFERFLLQVVNSILRNSVNRVVTLHAVSLNKKLIVQEMNGKRIYIDMCMSRDVELNRNFFYLKYRYSHLI